MSDFILIVCSKCGATPARPAQFCGQCGGQFVGDDRSSLRIPTGQSVKLNILGSSGDEYVIETRYDGSTLSMTCTCRAGELGQLCKHRLAVIGGDSSFLASPSETVAFNSAGQMVAASRVIAAYASMLAAIDEINGEKKKLDKQIKQTKAIFARRLDEGI